MSRLTTRYTSRKIITVPVLAFVWCFGYASGCWLCIPRESESLNIFRSVSLGGITLGGTLIASLVPVLLSALIFRYAAIYLIIPIVFVESFMSGYCHSLLLWCFGRAGWLIMAIFWLSKSVSNVILVDYCIVNLANAGKWDTVRLKRIIVICLVASVLECTLIRPLGIKLISKY